MTELEDLRMEVILPEHHVQALVDRTCFDRIVSNLVHDFGEFQYGQFLTRIADVDWSNVAGF